MLSDSGNRHADRLLSLTKELRWPSSSINAAKRGGREKKRSCQTNFVQNPEENETQGLP